MALQKQNFFLSIKEGVDTKTDEKNVVPTKFLELENATFTKTGSLAKRFGSTALPIAVTDGSTITSGAALTTFEEELLLYSQNNLYTFSEAQQKWANKGNVNTALADEVAVSSNGNILSEPDYDINGNLACYVYQNQATASNFADVEYRIVDNITQTVLFTGLIHDNVNRTLTPKVVSIGTKFYISYLRSNNLYYQYVDISTPTAISSQVQISTTPATNYDANLVVGKVYYIWGSTLGTNGVYVNNVDAAGVISSTTDIDPGFGQPQNYSVAEENGNVRLLYAQSGVAAGGGTGGWVVLYNAAMTTQIHPPVNFGNTFQVYGMTSIYNGVNSTVAYSQTYGLNVAGFGDGVRTFTIGIAGTIIADNSVIPQCILASKIVIYQGRSYMVIVKFPGDGILTPRTLRTFFLVTGTGEIVSKWAFEVGVTPGSPVGIYPSFEPNFLTSLRIENATLNFAGAETVEFQTNFQTSTSLLVAATAVKKYVANFSAVDNYFDATLGADLHIAGGILKMYDGDRVVEHGFLETPLSIDTVTVTSNGTTPGLGSTTTAGGVQYLQVYSWRDKAGQLQFSAPSIPESTAIPQASPNYSKAAMRLNCTPLTNKSNVLIELYRTTLNGTVFYKVNSTLATRVINDPTRAFIIYTDDVPDSELVTHELLYTTGGILENDAALSSKYVTTYKNRIMLLTSDGKQLQYSKLRNENGPVEFNLALVETLDQAGGNGIALGVMDDNVIIFKERSLFAFSGEGPNNLGQQDDFRRPYLVTSDCGCTEPNSIVLTPMGLMFKGEKGIYMLSRNLQASYIGAPVEAYNNLTITSATLLSDTNQVRFTTASGRTLMYDYYHNMWGTFTNQMVQDAVMYNDVFTYLTAAGVAMKEDSSRYDENGTYNALKVVSAWISLAGIQGFQRFRKFMFLGTYKSAHLLNVSFAFNFHDVYTERATIDTGSAFALEPNQQYQWSVDPILQKCQSFKVMLQDSAESSTGQAFELSNMAIELGIKQGLVPKSAAKAAGASRV